MVILPRYVTTYGAPQGSVVGLLLVLLYINDLTKTYNLLEFCLFADDTNIYFESGDANLNEIVNKELKKVKSWIDCNKLVINVDKTNFVLFHSPRKS